MFLNGCNAVFADDLSIRTLLLSRNVQNPTILNHSQGTWFDRCKGS